MGFSVSAFCFSHCFPWDLTWIYFAAVFSVCGCFLGGFGLCGWLLFLCVCLVLVCGVFCVWCFGFVCLAGGCFWLCGGGWLVAFALSCLWLNPGSSCSGRAPLGLSVSNDGASKPPLAKLGFVFLARFMMYVKTITTSALCSL